ncbi:ATP-binding cassette subfamily C protein CydD [Rhizobium sp. BK650]|uniref:thiol reductant ABC exporter subunit CydD n=1 Tax=Rhizobium sp. BK650 TaxID=2586990 RepID=UPI001611821F|nr:thiol reductant ABC exporter subunit CydD [Rhizobium sp. BK650]MBB3657868.1 ATP-binding cassette subfamily C protein CydD [Rhizobium sp. BK650]
MTRAFFDARDQQVVEMPDRKATARKMSKTRNRLRSAAMLQAFAAAFWIPQAGLLAWSVGRLADGGSPADLLWPAVFILLFGIVKSSLDAAGGRLAFCAARTELSEKRATAIRLLARLSPVEAGRPASGEAASVLGEQAEMIVPYLARFRPARMKASFVPLVTLACIFPISWFAALLLLSAAPLIPIFMALIGFRAQAASEKQLIATGSLNAFLLDRLRGLATIRSLDAVDATALRLRVEAESLRLRTMSVLKIAFLSSAVLELFSALGVAMTAVYVGFTLLGEIRFGTWSGSLDLSQGLFVLLLAPAFFEPLRELSAVWHDRASGEAALKALNVLAAKGMTLPEREKTEAFAANEPLAVRLENISFRYHSDHPPIIDGFNLDIAGGEHVALLGASGTGKSTLLSLIAGLAPCDEGRVLIDGAAADRSKLGWIGQRPHIFSGTVVGNIALGRAGITETEISKALELAKLGNVAKAYGHRPLGEGGIGFSGGEALRLAIARAACDREIRIILADEPTAHLDAETAFEITESLLALAEGRTLIVATHDPLLAARMNRTIRLGAERLLEAAE